MKTLHDKEKGKIECPQCNGYGYYAGHNTPETHPDGDCTQCPIQVECDLCEAMGRVTIEVRQKYLNPPEQPITSDDMPF